MASAELEIVVTNERGSTALRASSDTTYYMDLRFEIGSSVINLDRKQVNELRDFLDYLLA